MGAKISDCDSSDKSLLQVSFCSEGERLNFEKEWAWEVSLCWQRLLLCISTPKKKQKTKMKHWPVLRILTDY